MTSKRVFECDECARSGVKLWRMHGMFSNVPLLCGPCGIKHFNKQHAEDPSTIASIIALNPDGTHVSTWYFGHGKLTDELGWYVPAYENESGTGWWAGESFGAPEESRAAIDRWKALPL